MARVTANDIIEGFSGSIGNLVFRQLGNRTVVSKKSFPRKKQSELQRENRLRFKDATCYAKQAMNDPQRKAYYQQKAKKLRLPNAYTAAITDFMRKGQIKEVILKPSNGMADRNVIIKTHKKDFTVNKVKVMFKDAEGRPLHVGEAVKKENNIFIYSIPADVLSRWHSLSARIANPSSFQKYDCEVEYIFRNHHVMLNCLAA